MWGLEKLFRSSPHKKTAHALYLALVAQARHPAFYTDLEVPDTLDGRYEMIMLHAFLVIRHLVNEGTAGQALAQALFDTMFGDMDRALREMGVGDAGVGKHVKAMAKGYFGRAAAYELGISEQKQPLIDVITRNIYGTVEVSQESARKLAVYVLRENQALTLNGSAGLLQGQVSFGPPS